MCPDERERSMNDLFGGPGKAGKGAPREEGYSAKDIEVLEGLEPVRRRPGMYIGGTDERALHHLVAEILDNAMDEAVAGHASRIELELMPDDVLVVRDNGRGMPEDASAPRSPSLGLVGMRARAADVGGEFWLSRARAGGVRLTVDIPVPAPETDTRVDEDAHPAG